MKISIMSFCDSNNNYGQLLQCYALEQFYIKKGYKVEHILYSPIEKKKFLERVFKLFNPQMVKSYIEYKKKCRRVHREAISNPRKFDEFRKEHLNITREYKGLCDIQNDPPKADIYVVGSDQVWNFYGADLSKVRNLVRAYFLDFGPENIKRISYAASWGGMILDDEYIKEISPLLAKFDEVTVREKSGIELCKMCGRNDAKWVCDPTLLHSADFYRDFYKKHCEENSIKKDKPYIFVYYLNNGDTFNVANVFSWAERNGYSVVYVGANDNNDEYTKVNATIAEWLCYIDHADRVITNSFHCTLFSILFGTDYGVIRLSGNNEGMNDRFESLFEYTNSEPKYVNNCMFA